MTAATRSKPVEHMTESMRRCADERTEEPCQRKARVQGGGDGSVDSRRQRRAVFAHQLCDRGASARALAPARNATCLQGYRHARAWMQASEQHRADGSGNTAAGAARRQAPIRGGWRDDHLDDGAVSLFAARRHRSRAVDCSQHTRLLCTPHTPQPCALCRPTGRRHAPAVHLALPSAL